jgi:hypothetical protein
MSDRRAKQRQRIFKSAKIANNRGGVIACAVRDISKDGACLKVASPLGIPEEFELVLDDKLRQHCRVNGERKHRSASNSNPRLLVRLALKSVPGCSEETVQAGLFRF